MRCCMCRKKPFSAASVHRKRAGFATKWKFPSKKKHCLTQTTIISINLSHWSSGILNFNRMWLCWLNWNRLCGGLLFVGVNYWKCLRPWTMQIIYGTSKSALFHFRHKFACEKQFATNVFKQLADAELMQNSLLMSFSVLKVRKTC